jgi:hypothetical protein
MPLSSRVSLTPQKLWLGSAKQGMSRRPRRPSTGGVSKLWGERAGVRDLGFDVSLSGLHYCAAAGLCRAQVWFPASTRVALWPPLVPMRLGDHGWSGSSHSVLVFPTAQCHVSGLTLGAVGTMGW